METQRLLDLVHFFTFTCHDSLNLWLNCKVNEQAGGDAPKSIVPQALPLQKWVHMLRKEGAAVGLVRAFFIRFYRFFGGYAPKKHWIFSHETGWSCSEFCNQERGVA